MADRIEIDPHALLSAADISLSAATEIERVIGTLRSSLGLEDDTANFPWGKDSFGKKFADGPNGYKASREVMLAGGDGLAAGARGFADGQSQAAELMIASDSKE